MGSGLALKEGILRVTVEATEAAWDRVRKTGGPAPGPEWQVTPACRPEVLEGFPIGGAGTGGAAGQVVSSTGAFVLPALSV